MRDFRFLGLLGAGSALALMAGGAWAQSVAVAGTVGNKALLVINGSSPKAVAVGQDHQGVRVLSVSGDSVLLQSEGKRYRLRMGDAPITAGGMSAPALAASGADSGRRIVLSQVSGGHFVGDGFINDRAMRFMVDTGATSVSMGVADAERMGIDYKKGQPARGYTANGVVNGWRVRLNSVRIGAVQVYGVDAMVLQSSMPVILLGNSFLNRFTMTRNGDQMILDRRY